jgi:hypothetical protein
MKGLMSPLSPGQRMPLRGEAQRGSTERLDGAHVVVMVLDRAPR